MKHLFRSLILLSAIVSLVWAYADRDPAWVEQRIQQMQPTPQERRLDEIGWAKDIRDAERLAQKHGRPVFLFTHDGRINTGRC